MNIPLFKVHMNKVDIESVLQSGYISQGPIVELFESELKKLVSNSYCLTVNSATSGLTLAIRLAGADCSEVVSTPLTCFATTAAILANHCTILWTDVDKSCGMCLNSLRKTLTPNTRAIVIVHWGGVSVDLDELYEIRDTAEKMYGHPIYVIHDCAHAFLSEYDGRVIGTGQHNTIAVYSFQAIKHLTTGDGGMIVMPEELYPRAKRLRWFGIDRDGMTSRLENDITEYGYKFHMNDINAKIGLDNMEGLLHRREYSRRIADIYRSKIDCPAQTIAPKCKPNYWLYTLFMPNREEYITMMAKHGIQVSPVHKRNDINSCVNPYKKHLPQLEEIAPLIVSIPVGWWVTSQDAHKIVELTNQYYNSLNGKIYQPIRSKVVCRAAEYDDAKQAIELYNQERPIPIEVTEEEFVHYLDVNTSNNPTFLFVVEQDDKLIGMGKLIVEQKLGYKMGRIEDIYIHNQHRRKGHGSLLVKSLVTHAKTFNVSRIVLGTTTPVFYTSLGFQDAGVHMINYV
jgi:dTDP-4-amino-4,6-dideoxygalactose transaminase/GNAT superfamily N-acetyltransferase